jgi:hypothetical protein
MICNNILYYFVYYSVLIMISKKIQPAVPELTDPHSNRGRVSRLGGQAADGVQAEEAEQVSVVAHLQKICDDDIYFIKTKLIL